MKFSVVVMQFSRAKSSEFVKLEGWMMQKFAFSEIPGLQQFSVFYEKTIIALLQQILVKTMGPTP